MPITVIHTGLSLQEFSNLLTTLALTRLVASYKVSYDHNGLETDRIIAVMHKNAFEVLKKREDLKISLYRLDTHNYPRSGFSNNFYLPLPHRLQLSESKLRKQIENKLTRLGIGAGELTGDFDLVKSGLLDSMAFVDLVVRIEKQYNIEVNKCH